MDEKDFQERKENGECENQKSNPNQASNFGESIKKKLNDLDADNEKVRQILKEVIQEQEGQNINIVLANTIQNSSFFRSMEYKEKENLEDEQKYCLIRDEDFLMFVKKRKNSCLKLYLFMLIGIRVIEINKLNEYMEQMKLCIGWTEEQILEDMELPFSKVCCLLGVDRVEIRKNTKAGIIIQEAIGYNEEEIKILRRIFWENYVNLREPLIKWLTGINEGKQYPGAVLAGIGLAELAQIDFAFLYDRIEKQVKKIYTVQQISCIARIMKNAWEIDAYRENIVNMLHNWMEQEKSQAWIISLICWISNSSMVERSKLQKCLKKKIEIFSIEQNWAGFLVLKAHQSLELCHLLYDSIADFYIEAENRIERELVCLQYLSILYMESCLISEKGESLAFIQVLGEKECREKQKPMMLFIWRILEYRRFFQSILDKYLIGIPVDYDETCLKKLFMMLAFTGQKNDFENMEVYLKRKTGYEKHNIKMRLYQEFQELLMQRRQLLEVKGRWE